MDIKLTDQEFFIVHNGKVQMKHSMEEPMLYIGYGQESVDMYRGNFKIEDYVIERYPLRGFDVTYRENTTIICFEHKIEMTIEVKENLLQLDFKSLDTRINRFWIRVCSNEEEKLYGCGEQMSYFNLKGRNFPLWTSEPGVGRDKTTYLTWRCDVDNKSGGDYYNTNYPQPTYVSSNRYFLHADTTAYAEFDFRHKDFTELLIWEVPKSIRIETADSFLSLAEKLSAYFGRQPILPDWIYKGAILGLQGGTQRVCDLLEHSLEAGIQVAGIWCQDWEGKRVTSFGKRLQWDWKWNESMYPGLPEKIREWKDMDIRFLGYINPYLVQDGTLYKEGEEKGYFAVSEDGSEYLVDFGEFYCGVVDLTNPDAYNWFKEIIKRNLIDFGLSGWMADFGEYLPTDLTLYNQISPMIEHNHWPLLWAKCNYEALKETGKLEEVVYFMRAGAAGIQQYCPLLWAGDQSVDFTIHDGLASVVVGALSAAVMGCGLHHCDIGGYTSLYDNIRTKEVFLRWAEMTVFSPVMRTHEGNRPETNFQYYDEEDTMRQFGRLTQIHVALAPYLKDAVSLNASLGIPVQRPLFYHYEKEEEAYLTQTEYLLGRDVLVAPVYQDKKEKWEVYLPEDEWIHLWSAMTYTGGHYEVSAPLGEPPVFYRKDSGWATLFEEISRTFR